MTGKMPSWDKITEGYVIPPLAKKPTYVQLFMFSAITWNRHLIHYNPEYARHDGLPDVATHRALIGNFLAQMLCDWAGTAGRIGKLEWSVRATVVPGNAVICRGKVLGKHIEGTRKTIECEIWVESESGEVIAPGKSEIVLFD